MTDYQDVFGGYATPAEILHQWRAEAARSGETFPAWLERQSRELWTAGEHGDEDWASIAAAIEAAAED